MELLERMHAFLSHQYNACANFVSLEREICDNCLEMHSICHRYFSIQHNGYTFFQDDIYAKYLFELLSDKYYVLSSSLDYPYISNSYFCTDCYKPISLQFDYGEDDVSKNYFYIEFLKKETFNKQIISYHLFDMLSWQFDQLTDNKNIFVFGVFENKESSTIDNFSFNKNNVSLQDFNSKDGLSHYSLCRFVVNEFDISFRFKSKGMKGFVPKPILSVSKEDIKDIAYFDFYSNTWSPDFEQTLKNNIRFSKKEPNFRFHDRGYDESLYHFISKIHQERKNIGGD